MEDFQEPSPVKKYGLIGGGILLLALILWFVFSGRNLDGIAAIPFVSHQQPILDPHLPAPDALSDKLDELVYDGIFNITASPSGYEFENGLGEFVSLDANNVVTIRLKPGKKWHTSFDVTLDDEEVKIAERQAVMVTARDIAFSLQRIQTLGSLSPDFVLVGQALKSFEFTGPDANNEIKFRFHDKRLWVDNDIKEVLSFKVLPATSEMLAVNHPFGSGPFLTVTPNGDFTNFYKNPAENAFLNQVLLEPYVDNSTFESEMKKGNVNVLLGTPFGSASAALADPEKFFAKPNISTTFFALLFNTERVPVEQRRELRKLFNNQTILNRFFKTGTEQARQIMDYKGTMNNYNDFLNYSVFPSSSYYVDEKIVVPNKVQGAPNFANLPDTIKVRVNLNQGSREELTEILEILNERSFSNGRIQALAVNEEAIRNGQYDVLLMAFNGYRSNFLFDLYDIFLRDPDMSRYQINLVPDPSGNGASPTSLQASKNFFRLDATRGADAEGARELLKNMVGFMASPFVGDRQVYSARLDEAEHDLALGAWLFSLPSLNYFSTHFSSSSINLYGVSSQLSTAEKWQQVKK